MRRVVIEEVSLAISILESPKRLPSQLVSCRFPDETFSPFYMSTEALHWGKVSFKKPEDPTITTTTLVIGVCHLDSLIGHLHTPHVILCDNHPQVLRFFSEYCAGLLEIYKQYKNEAGKDFTAVKDDIEKFTQRLNVSYPRSKVFFDHTCTLLQSYHFLANEQRYQFCMQALQNTKISYLNLNLFAAEEVERLAETLRRHEVTVHTLLLNNLPDYDLENKIPNHLLRLPRTENATILWWQIDRVMKIVDGKLTPDKTYGSIMCLASSVREYEEMVSDQLPQAFAAIDVMREKALPVIRRTGNDELYQTRVIEYAPGFDPARDSDITTLDVLKDFPSCIAYFDFGTRVTHYLNHTYLAQAQLANLAYALLSVSRSIFEIDGISAITELKKITTITDGAVAFKLSALLFQILRALDQLVGEPTDKKTILQGRLSNLVSKFLVYGNAPRVNIAPADAQSLLSAARKDYMA